MCSNNIKKCMNMITSICRKGLPLYQRMRPQRDTQSPLPYLQNGLPTLSYTWCCSPLRWQGQGSGAQHPLKSPLLSPWAQSENAVSNPNHLFQTNTNGSTTGILWKSMVRLDQLYHHNRKKQLKVEHTSSSWEKGKHHLFAQEGHHLT